MYIYIYIFPNDKASRYRRYRSWSLVIGENRRKSANVRSSVVYGSRKLKFTRRATRIQRADVAIISISMYAVPIDTEAGRRCLCTRGGEGEGDDATHARATDARICMRAYVTPCVTPYVAPLVDLNFKPPLKKKADPSEERRRTDRYGSIESSNPRGEPSPLKFSGA